MRVSLVVPYRPDPRAERVRPHIRQGAHRSVIWSWLRQRWEAQFPDFEIVTGAAGPAEMNRSQSRNAAVAEATGEVLVVADADTVARPEQITAALDRIDQGAEWVIAYEDYYQLPGPDTRRILALDPTSDIGRPRNPRWSTDQGNAGMMVLTRDAWDEVKGYDERFQKWGLEDWAFANALETLVHPQTRVPGYVIHLCHPRPLDRSKSQGKALFERYDEAHGNPDAMRAILNEPGRRA